MTAINMMVQPKARTGFIVSDGAHTSPEGILLRNSPKVIHGTRFPWAMGITGNVQPEVLFAELAKAQPLNPKQLIRRLPECMRRAVAVTAEAREQVESDILLQVSGTLWDAKAKRIEGFVVTSQPGTFLNAEMEPYVWYETNWTVPIGDGGLHAYLGRDVDFTDPTAFDPHGDGLALIQVQRERGVINRTPGLTDEACCRIGGDVDLTEVTRRGVKVWKIHEWPDVIGERINPHG